MPGPLAVWAARKAMKSKTGQKIKGQVMEAIGGLKDDAMARGHAALSQHQFPSSPPWGEPSPGRAPAPPPWEGAPSDFDKPNSPPPPW